MGFDILKAKLDEIRANRPASKQTGWFNLNDLVCLDEFLKLLARNLTALAQFKALLEGLIVTSASAIAGLQLLVAQLEVAIGVAETFINTFKSAANAQAAALKLFPFAGEAINCPPIQKTKEYLKQRIPFAKAASLAPGNVKRLAKKYKQATQSVKELEYKVFRHRRAINDFKKQIEEIRIQILAWQAMVDAITEQFGV